LEVAEIHKPQTTNLKLQTVKMIRRTSIFSGHVQGVGFRYTARGVARSRAVTGYVRNLPDGNVELVVEGEASEIDALLKALSEKMDEYIRKRTDEDAPATGEFQNFTIRT
jgi:acylphosphatase